MRTFFFKTIYHDLEVYVGHFQIRLKSATSALFLKKEVFQSLEALFGSRWVFFFFRGVKLKYLSSSLIWRKWKTRKDTEVFKLISGIFLWMKWHFNVGLTLSKALEGNLDVWSLKITSCITRLIDYAWRKHKLTTLIKYLVKMRLNGTLHKFRRAPVLVFQFV